MISATKSRCKKRFENASCLNTVAVVMELDKQLINLQ